MTRPIVGFEHLHLHSHKSLLDGFGLPSEYAAKWKSHGDYLCISDHGMMAVIPEQIRACKATGDKDDPHKDKALTPIFACELYVNPLQIEYNSEKEWKDYIKSLSPEAAKSLRKSYHLLAIAYNNVGYSNLVTLTSLAHLKGFYYRPRLNHQQLMQYKEGIIFTSCCYMSEIAQAFDAGGEEAGFAMIEKYMAMFGKDFRLELMLLDFHKQKPYDAFIIKAHLKYGIPLIITNDCHFCEAGHSKFQQLMLMVQTKYTFKDVKERMEKSGDQDFFFMQDKNLYMKIEEEINAKYDSDYSDVIPYELFEQAKKNTVEICRSVNVTLDRTMKLPVWPDADEKLKEETIKGFKRRGLPFTKEYQSRLREEFELIFALKFSSYFLILKVTVDEARRYSMEMFGTPNAVGPGRGSDVGSLICYCLGITNVNPIKHGLLFSRFLSKARKDWPDADVDFIPQVRDYLKNEWAAKYFGADRVCNIGSYNTFGIKSSLIDMARVHDKDRYEILNLTTKIGLKDDDGNVMTWDRALEMFPELKKYCDDNPDVAEAAQMMVGRSRSMGKHAGGIVISSEPINKYVPLVRGSEGEPVSAWTEGLHDQDLQPMGFIKYDWLVITNLLQINYACKLIKERHGLANLWAKDGLEDFSDDNFIDDAKAIVMANEADLKGVFQFDSEGIRSLVKRAGINSFDDLVAITALYRPGPMGEGQHDEFVARKKGKKPYELHVILQPILGNTYGVICFQEQCMKIFHAVGLIPLEDCYNLIKAISKKKKDIFEKYKIQFIENGQKTLGWPLEEVEALWKQLEGFAGYAFNLSHAVAYTYISFMLLVLKAHYPLEFFASILHYESVADKMKEYKCDAERHEVKIEALDLNKSRIYFDITDDKVYFGFANVKGVGEAVAERIVANQPYDSFSEFLNKYGTDESVIKPLIGLGLFTKDGKPETLYKYYKWYKDIKEKRDARRKRYEASLKRYDDEEMGILEDGEEKQKMTLDIGKRRQRTIELYGKKPTDKDPIPPLSQFLLEQTLKDVAEEDKEPEIEDKLIKLLNNAEECEQSFYGFLWHHPIRNSPDYEGNRTFELFRERGEPIGYVEVVLKSVARQTSKKNKDVHYWLLKAEDANGEEAFIQVWEDDWIRFGSELKDGELFKLQIKPPDKGFNRYTLWTPKKWPKWEYDKLIPKDRAFDLRVVPLRKAELIK
jgi:DNA polymerase-3 subunit alpha